MNKIMIFALILGLVVVYGCASSQMTFEKGVKEINELDKKYGSSLKSTPNSTDRITGLVVELNDFKAGSQNIPEPLAYLVDFRIKFLEAEKLNAEGWQWGKGSTIDYGFGCKKGYARITESARLRNASAQKGYEAVGILQEFIDNYPKEVESIGIAQKDILLLNAQYFQTEEKAARDARVIKSMCKKQANQTAENGA